MNTHNHLQQLGKTTVQPTSPQEAKLEAIPNVWNESSYSVQLICEEFTCVCPMTGQPDFAKLLIEYRPDGWLVESKSLKLYLGSYRNVGIFHEFVINMICRDLAQLLNPKNIKITGHFSSRGGIRIEPTVTWMQGDVIPSVGFVA